MIRFLVSGFLVSFAMIANAKDASLLYGHGGAHFVELPRAPFVDCHILTAAPAYANSTESGCQAASKDQFFAVFSGANNAIDANSVRKLICGEGAKLRDFEWGCYSSVDKTQDWVAKGASLPTNTARVFGTVRLQIRCDQIPDKSLCPKETDTRQLGCVAEASTDRGDQIVQSNLAGNNCLAYVDLFEQICSRNTRDRRVSGMSGCIVEP